MQTAKGQKNPYWVPKHKQVLFGRKDGEREGLTKSRLEFSLLLAKFTWTVFVKHVIFPSVDLPEGQGEFQNVTPSKQCKGSTNSNLHSVTH